jgi:23S rRNA pseudouridine2605 synthase
MEAVGLVVNRLIRVSYGPFRLGDLAPGRVEEVRAKVLRDQLGLKAGEAVPGDAEPTGAKRKPAGPGKGPKGPGPDGVLIGGCVRVHKITSHWNRMLSCFLFTCT